MNNRDLRRALHDACSIDERCEYIAQLRKLRDEFGHSIAIEDSLVPEDRFNCFAYAFGLVDLRREYEALVERTQDSAMLKSNIVHEMLCNKDLGELRKGEPNIGDVVLYFDAGRLMHAGVAVGDGRFSSKWRSQPVHSHALWEVPSIYGQDVGYVRRPDRRWMFSKIECVKGTGRHCYHFQQGR